MEAPLVFSVIPSRYSFARIFIHLTTGMEPQNRAEIDCHFHRITTTMNVTNQVTLITFLTPLPNEQMSEDKIKDFLVLCAGIVHYYPRLFVNTLCNCNEQIRRKTMLLLRCFISSLILQNHSLQSVFHTRTPTTHREMCLVWIELIRRHRDTHPHIRRAFLEISTLLLYSSPHLVDQNIQKSALSKLVYLCRTDPIFEVREMSLSLLSQFFEVDPTKVFCEEVFQLLHWLCQKEKKIRMRLNSQQEIFTIYENLLMHYPLQDFKNHEIARLAGILVEQYKRTSNVMEKKWLEEILQRMKQLHTQLKK